MPLWSNEEWRAHIGSSWCVLGRHIKCKSSVSLRGGGSGSLQLSGGTLLQTVSMVMMLILMAVIKGIEIIKSQIIGCQRILQGSGSMHVVDQIIVAKQ